MSDGKRKTENANREELTAEKLERELEEARRKLDATEKLIETVDEELKQPWEEEYEESPCCEDDYEGDLK